MNDQPSSLPATAVTAEELLGDEIDPTPQPASGSADAVNGVPSSSETPTPPPAEPANPFAGVKDSRGIEFHPAKHRIKDGAPQLDSLKRFVPLGLGRRSGEPGPGNAETPTPPGARSALPPDDPPEVVPELTAEIGAEVAINLIQTALIMIGEEEGELTELEAKMLRGPMLRVLQKYNLSSKMTPEMETAAVVASLVLRRLKKPKTQGWFLGVLSKLKAWWLARKLKHKVGEAIPV